MDQDRMRQGIAQLRDWLRDNKDKWIEAGPPRELGDHGPMTRQDRRLWEVQIPIKAARAAGGAKADDQPVRVPRPPTR
jgi:hypothetical protein